MSNRLFQSIVHQMKDAIDRTIGVVDKNGCIIACSELVRIGETLEGVKDELTYTNEPFRITVFTWKGMLTERAIDMAAIMESHAPSTPRNASCAALSGPSREKEHAITPAPLSSSSRAFVTTIPQGAKTLRMPSDVARLTRLGRSSRVIGSPPVHMISGFTDASESST